MGSGRWEHDYAGQGEGGADGCSPNTQNDIPWLLIKVQAAGDHEGTFTKVVYIQRVDTQGGQAPAEAPRRAGTQAGVAYRATSYFYGRAD